MEARLPGRGDQRGGAGPCVAHVSQTFSALSEAFLYDLLTEVARSGLPSSVITFRRLNKAGRPFQPVVAPGPLCRLGLRATWLAMRTTHDYIHTLHRILPLYRRVLARLVDRLDFDVMHCHFGPMAVLAEPLATARGIPTVLTFYGFDISTLPHHKVWRMSYERLWPKLSAAVVLSEHMCGILEHLGCPSEKIRIVRLAYPRQAEFRLPQRRVKTLISIGRLVEKKGHVDAIQALAKLRDSYPDVTLRIIGDGPQRVLIKRAIEENGMSDRVALLGPQPRSVVLEEVRKADAFVLCSRTAGNGDREGTPTALLEAAATGLPCVSTRHAGIPEIIAPENHWLLAEEGDIRGIAARLDQLIQSDLNTLVRTAEAGSRHVRDRHDLGTQASHLIRLYKEIWKESARGTEQRHVHCRGDS